MDARYFILTLVAATLVVAIEGQTSYPLRDYINVCALSDPKFNECTLRSARAAIKQFAKGDKERGIPSMEPMFIKEIKAIGRKGDGLSVVLTDAKLYGCSDLDLKKFKMDTVKRRITARATGNLVIDATYEINGRILIIPLNGKGHALVNLNNTKVSYTFDYELKERADGKRVGYITTDNLKYDIGHASFYLENLFSGDKILGESTNRLLNDSWKDIISDVGPPVAKILKEGFTKAIKKFMSQHTYEELFLL